MLRHLYSLVLCSTAFLVFASCASATERFVVFETIALSGDVAPGDGSPFGREFEARVINDKGEVAFLASASDTGIWLGTKESLDLLAGGGDFAPGAGISWFRDFFTRDLLINDKGEVAFAARIRGFGVTVENELGIWAGTPNRLSLVARNGGVAPGTIGKRFRFIGFGGPPRLSFNNKGKVAFRTSLVRDGVPVDSGIWVGASIYGELVVRGDDVAPGTDGARFSGLGVVIFPVPLNDRDEIAFRGELEGPGIDGSNDQGIWFGRGETWFLPRDRLALIARLGDTAPGTEGLVYRDELSNPPILNETRKIGFTAQLSGRGFGVWSGTAKKLSLLARSGDTAPGTGGAVFGGFTAFAGATLDLNERGEFVVVSGLQGPAVDESNDTGIWYGRKKPIALVAREGDIAPGTGGETFGQLIVNDKIFINNYNQVAFAARTGSGVGLWISSKHRKLNLVVRQGDEFEVAPGDTRTVANFQGQPDPDGISNFFDFGDRGLVFALDFTDGTSGVFTARLGRRTIWTDE